MPELSRFGGMVIYMLFCDTEQHNKPHVHVYYGEYEAAIAIDGWHFMRKKHMRHGILPSKANISIKFRR